MSTDAATTRPTFSRSLAGRLLAGLVVFGGAIWRMAASYEPVTFEQELARVAALREAGAHTTASAYLRRLLEDEERPGEQLAAFYRLLAEIIYEAEAPLRVHTEHNARAIVQNYRASLRFGIYLTADNWVHLADAYRWLGDLEPARDLYRLATQLEPSDPIQVRRKLVAINRELNGALRPRDLEDLEILCAEADASNDTYLWALGQRIEWAVDQGEIETAEALVAEGQARLRGSADSLAMRYYEALCLQARGRLEDATVLLRSLRNEWTSHDRLWAKAGWLLGTIEQADGRPQSGLAFFDEVIGAVPRGRIYDACRLGYAECLASLERYAASIAVFRELARQILTQGGHPDLERDVLRTTMTVIAEDLIVDGNLEHAIAFLRVAMDLVNADDAALRAHYLGRIAGTLTARAELLRDRKDTARADGVTSRGLYAEAGQTYLALADTLALDEAASASALERAADSFDAAGRPRRTVEVLTRFVDEHPTSERRLSALYRLGQAHQADQRYDLAIRYYDEAIAGYLPLPDALRSMVPLAESLIRNGGDGVERGVNLLISIVDDRGASTLFDPAAKEYRDALLRLGEYYMVIDDAADPDRLAKAIVRLESFVDLYPDDPAMPQVRFRLADAYRQSAGRFEAEIERQGSDDDTTALEDEVKRRYAQAYQNYDRVIRILAARDAGSLNELEQTYLRASYQYRGDCLFQLGLYDEALAAYRETAWRFENEPIAVAAAMQVIHCHQRLGRLDDARAALARMKWLLSKIPASAFDAEDRLSSKAYWQSVTDRLEQSGVF